MRYDIFISYRRNGGSDIACKLKNSLSQNGYKVFLDINALGCGNVDTQLIDKINECKDFILIVDEHTFDRCLDPNFDQNKDMLRIELAHALRMTKNVVPIFLSDECRFPHNLPIDIADVARRNALYLNNNNFNEAYENLKNRFLHKRRAWPRSIFIYLVPLIILLICKLFPIGSPPMKKTNTVDLGLPSGTIWYTRNIGAEYEYDDGALYAWGNTMPGWRSQSFETRENIIGTSYDTALMILGDHYRLPSEKQITELIEKCNWDWKNENGHVGYLITGPNGKSMFLPAAGCMKRNGLIYCKQFGYYWIGEGHPKDSSQAKELIIGANERNIEFGSKNLGRSVRAIYIE